MESQRKKKSGRLRRRMRSALARLRRPITLRLGRSHGTDDDQLSLVTTDEQPEVDSIALRPVTQPEPEEPEVRVRILRKFTTSYGGHLQKSTSGYHQKKRKEDIEIRSPEVEDPPSSSDQNRLIDIEETPDDDDVISGALSRLTMRDEDHVTTAAITPEVETADEEEVVSKSEGRRNRRNVRGVSWEDDTEIAYVELIDTEERAAEVRRRHRKRKRAKRYARRAGVRMWKGMRVSWKFLYSGLMMLTTSPAMSMNVPGGIAQAWQDWNDQHQQRYR